MTQKVKGSQNLYTSSESINWHEKADKLYNSAKLKYSAKNAKQKFQWKPEKKEKDKARNI